MEKENFTKQDILEKIAVLRNQKNISAYQLGRQLGHSKTYMYRVETGAIQLTIDTFLDILDILGITTSEFFSFNDEEKKEAKDPLLELIEKLPEETKNALTSFIIKLKA